MVDRIAMTNIEWESVVCNVCGSGSSSVWKDAARGFYTGTWRLVRCEQCGLIYMSPRPTQQSIMQYYSDTMYGGVWGKDKDQLGSFRDKLVRMVAEECYGYRRANVRQSSLKGMLRKMIAHPFRHKLCRIPPHRSSGRLLDIGSGSARDLTLAKEFGWKTYGLEISEMAVAQGEQAGHNMFLGSLEQANYPNDFFHAVTMFDVVEHLHNPRRTLSEVYRILAPGGFLLLRTPDVKSAQARLFGNKWWPLNHLPHHLYFFSASTMERLLKDLGFHVGWLSHTTSPRCTKQYFDYLWADSSSLTLEHLPLWVKVADSFAGAFLYMLIEHPGR